MKPRLVLVLGDQLTTSVAALKAADPFRDIVVMAEVKSEGTYVRHNKKKILLMLAAMRNFAKVLQQQGWKVQYSRLDDPTNSQSISGELLRYANAFGAEELIATEPGEFRLITILKDMPLKLQMLEDDRFIASHAMFKDWSSGRKTLRMEYFYREMRRKTGLLMDDGQPIGGKWNYDIENRKPAKDDLLREKPLQFEPDDLLTGLAELIDTEFERHPGTTEDFWYATTREQALEVLDHFIRHHLKVFGSYQDAMLDQDPFLHHSLLSAYVNIGLLDPMEVCERIEHAYRVGDVPLNSAEGFIRQIIGWREYMRGIYFYKGPDYVGLNALHATRDLPDFFWTAETDMQCLRRSIHQTLHNAYAHHIQRLMVIGNFAMMAGIDPYQVHEWYLSVYWDAFEWVEAPNVIGMSQFADDGLIASKPYASSGAYINRMSDYCKSCAYTPLKKMGEGACPFNLLYWSFLDRHSEKFEKNPRMAQIYANWKRRAPKDKTTVLEEADRFLNAL
ncbi:MAG: cryptochrome/photolyase family protein [Pseudomonadota bacterium]